ncbi:MAG TPA: NAD-dependent epimerase/dehydratase family protein, partial [Allosphingosinicella sp.]
MKPPAKPRKVRTIAVTGGTGFVGSHLLRIAVAAGFEIRALTRGWKPPEEGIDWVEGALDRPDCLIKLCTGADAVVHIAGAINAENRAGFERVNVAGTAAMIDATRRARVRRFVHVSSLAAREPKLSDYGWSKAKSERLVAASGLDWTIVRPPAVYGPGDRETLQLFKMARRGFVALPPRGRFSVIHVEDLCRLLLALVDEPETIGETYEPDDGR